MVKIFGLDIPPGLEDLWTSFFQFTDKSLQNNFILKTAVPTRQKRALWNIKSLFVRWQFIYDLFGSTRKAAWTAYWASLPFGSHSGGGGWPGSGFSAFVYWNAPRFKAGLDLDYDPPGGPDLVENGAFVGGYFPWLLENGPYWSANQINFSDSGIESYVHIEDEDHNFSVVNGGTYRFQYDWVLLTGFLETFLFNNESSHIRMDFTHSFGSGHYSADYTFSGESQLDFWTPFFLMSYNAIGYITNVSVRKIS